LKFTKSAVCKKRDELKNDEMVQIFESDIFAFYLFSEVASFRSSAEYCRHAV
jgi:hypothetical protein